MNGNKKKIGFFRMLANVLEASIGSALLINAPLSIIMLIVLLPLSIAIICVSFIATLISLPYLIVAATPLALHLYKKEEDNLLLWMALYAALASTYGGLITAQMPNQDPTFGMAVFFIHGSLLGFFLWGRIFSKKYDLWGKRKTK